MQATKVIRPYEGFQERFVRSNVDVVFGGGQLGAGKEQPLHSKVLTPNGWVRIGDLKVGDMVCTPFGKPSSVLQIFEHKAKDIYRIETIDGRTAECGIEHLWAVRTEKQKAKYNKDRDKKAHLTICNTEELINRLRSGRETYIPVPSAQEFAEKTLPIHPYVMGVLIGDGSISEKALHPGANSLVISNTEQDIIERVYSLLGCYGLTINKLNHNKSFFSKEVKQYKEYIASVGLNVRSYDKFIPEDYLWGSVEQRRQLLQGLMDTDGSVSKKNAYSFSTTSKKLCGDFVNLCRSLGYIAVVHTDKRIHKYTSGIAYEISIRTNDIIFSSEKHLTRYKNNIEDSTVLYHRTNDHIAIKSINKVGVSDTRCIYIEDESHLYITDDFITTHNTFGAILAAAESTLDSKFRAVFLRNNLDDLKSGGGVLDSFREVFGSGVKIVESGNPKADFASGASVDVTHVADQTKKKLEQRFKGRQYDMIYYDELTGFTWDCFSFLFSRNRGQAKWTGKVRATTNPKKSHWLRTFLDWYIGPDGEIREDREGVVRYFYNAGVTEKEVVWGDTKEEVYHKCKAQIDRFLKRVNGKNGTATYEDVIKSFTFYLGRTSDNKALGSSYAASVAAMGGRMSEENAGNWNIDSDEREDAELSLAEAQQVLLNDPQINGDRWVTCDLADVGTDNFVCLAWDGFHVIDCLTLAQTTPRQNAERLEMFADSHGVANNHIIYDATRALYINDYIPEAIPFISGRHPMGMYARMAIRLKDECYLRLVEMIKRGGISIADKVADRIYEHQLIKESITFANEFIEECLVVSFKEVQSGKKTLLTKKEMNRKLGKGRSMDVLDPFAMRMLPVLECPYGEELEMSAHWDNAYHDDDDSESDIYSDSMWC